MRIGVSGSAGTGKSRLCADLAAKLKLPLIPDFTDEILREHNKTSWRGITDTRVRRQIRLEVLERKIKAESAAEAFVSEKTVVDYLAYWLQNQFEFETPDQNLAFVARVRETVVRYTHRIFLPYRSAIDYAPNRNTDPVHNMRVAAMVRGLYGVLKVEVSDAPYVFGEDVGAWVAKWLPEPKTA